MAKNITLKEIKNNKKIEVLVNHANDVLEHIGYTEHGRIHVGYVSKVAGDILQMLKYDARTVELARIAGWIHDIGNSINRKHHGMNGALLLYPLLTEMGMDMEEIAVILVRRRQPRGGNRHVGKPRVGSPYNSGQNRTRTAPVCAAANTTRSTYTTGSITPSRKTG